MSTTGSGSDAFAWVGLSAEVGSVLTDLLMAPEIVPGSDLGYQLAKTIYAYHPLGAILVDAPIKRAQSHARQINVPVLASNRLIERYEETWSTLGKSGGTMLIHRLCATSRMYGIASLAVGERGKNPSSPLDMNKLADADLYFNVFDPLNTAGSLVLNQDPNSPDFLKPSDHVRVNGQHWHPSRLFVKMNEDPIYIEWTPSAFGFVGRSVYQRALFPLKTYVQSMITDQMVTQKAGLLVAKLESPGSIADQLMQKFLGIKRGAIKAGATNQVLSVGVTEDIETLNMQNLDKAASFARANVLKNIASAAGMPASIIMQETMQEGFGEGTEDANKEIDYLNYIREDMDPAYAFLDAICRRKAWTPEFYQTLFADYPTYKKKPFDTAIYEWIRAFNAVWPNLKIEPDSEKSKTADVKLKAVVAIVETMSELLDPENKANLIEWVADNVNEANDLFAGKLDIDTDKLLAFLKENREAQIAAPEASEEHEPHPFSQAS